MIKATVLMTVYNGLPYLRNAVDSILKQTFSQFEFLIINDCSNDGTRDVLLGYDDLRIRLVDNSTNLKQTRSLNVGLGIAKGEIIVRMDADDVSHPQRLQMQVEYMERHPEVAVVGSNLRYIDEKGRITGRCSRPEGDLALKWLQFFSTPIACGAAAFRKSIAWGELGGFNESITVIQDRELWSRLMPNHKVGNIPRFLLDVRKHSARETITSHGLAEKERRYINQMNPRRILGIEDESDSWLRKLDSLVVKSLEHPEFRNDVIRILFERFCRLYPEANRDKEVLTQLIKQYARTMLYSKPQHFVRTLKSYRSCWPRSLKKSRALYPIIRCIPEAVQWALRS